ncbi:POTE ankyrin domain family member A-like [Nycticebus coucang]|uniref:POTE ankyrin domain family member A-like n=1 Tax=Nycticebus coucang TaxID=9470 RepID=UPI00234DCF1C|nr:POTE ankyrin domain family member A-like [Nycticebus coucang]
MASAVKKIWGLGSKKVQEFPEDSSPCVFSSPYYRVHKKHLRKIHKAAFAGDAKKVEQILSSGKNGVDATDKKNRTALHLACTKGHLAVVILLLERQCQLNICDREKRTPLMKAVHCQEWECAISLLEYGADPNLQDIYGNTALHYAVYKENMLLVQKLLSHNASIEIKNKGGFTPLLLAVNYNRQLMVEFLIKRNANISAVDNWERTALMIALRENLPDIASFLLQQGIDVSPQDMVGRTARDYAIRSGLQAQLDVDVLSLESWHTSDDEDVFGSDTQDVPKLNLKELYDAFLKSRKNYWDSTSLTISDKIFKNFENSKVDIKSSSVAPSMIKNKPESPELGQKNSLDKEKIIVGPVSLAGNATLHESQPPENKECEEEQDVEVTSKEKQEKLEGNKNNQPQVKKQIYAVDDLDDLSQSSETSSEDAELSSFNYEKFMLQIEQLGMDCEDASQITMGLCSDKPILSPSPCSTPQNSPEDYVTQLKIQDAFHSCKRFIELKHNRCKKMKNLVSVLLWEISELKEIKSELELKEAEWQQKFCSLRFTLKQEEEKRRNADLLYERIKEELRRKEAQYRKEVEVKQQLEQTLRTRNKELRTVKMNLDEILHSKEKDKDLFHKNCMLQEETTVLRLERDIIKKQNEENKRKYFEDIAVEKQKNDDLQKAIQLNTETLTETVSQLNVLIAETSMLKSTLENEKQNKETQETGVQTYCSRLAALQNMTSKKNLENGHSISCAQSENEKEVKKLTESKKLLEDNLDQEKKKNSKLEKRVTRLKCLLKIATKLNEHENEEFNFHEDVKTRKSEKDIEINKLKHEMQQYPIESTSQVEGSKFAWNKNTQIKWLLSNYRALMLATPGALPLCSSISPN